MTERETKAQELKTTPRTRWWRGYGVAVAATVVAALARWALGRAVGELPPYTTFYLAVLAAAVAGGTGPGVLATILSALAADLLFIDPHVGKLEPATMANAVGLGLFIAINLAISVVGGRLRMKSEVRSPKSERRPEPVTAIVFVAAAGVLVGSMALVYWIGLAALKSNRELGRQQEVGEHLVRLASTLKDAETWQQGYLLTGEASYLEPYGRALGEMKGELEHLGRMAGSGELPGQPVSEVRRLNGEKLAELEQTAKLRREGKLEEALEIARSNRGKEVMDSIRSALARMEASQVAEFRAANRRAEQATRERNWAFLAMVMLNVGFLAWAHGRITLEMRGREAAREEVHASEARLRTVVESLLEGVVVSDLKGNLLHWNRAALDMYGFSSLGEGQRRLGELSELFEVSAMDGTAWSLEQRPMARILRGEELRECEARIRHRREGWQRVFSYGGSLIRDGEGRPLMAVMTVSDITKRKRTEEALRESEARLRIAHQAAHIGAFEWNVQTGVNIWTPELEAMYGLKPGEFGRTESAWEQLVHPEDRAKAVAVVERAFETFQPEESEWRVVWPDGSVHWVVGRFQVFKDHAGKPLQLAGVNLDITDRKEAEQDLRRLKDELEVRVEQRTAELAAANQELREFATIVSHDLRAPLRGVATLAKWLQSDYADQLDDEGHENLVDMVKRIGRMDRMIEGILEYSRVGRAEEKCERVALAELVPTVVEDLHPPGEVEVGIAPGLPAVEGDPVRLRQVFQNLIDNAVKHGDKPAVKVCVGYAGAGAFWEFLVADNGPGIEPRHFERIFKIFQTLAAKDKTDSTGVGLALVKRIVERAGGRVWVESQVGQGTTFHFTWPKGKAKGVAAPQSSLSERL